ncbi:MAG: amidohydrolase [Mycolicibacter arupensis]|uniref:6-methylsalicylate decarboxylase n=1 Tax=Mycolicibacter arupensis TaxID=342002 RepID=A0A5C7XJ22_9MYCO|nr:MAG: amidohydrolase [Mycolicibacter arupensis]
MRDAIDVHAHFLTPSLRTAMIDAGHERPDGMPVLPEWNPDIAMSVMDRTGIRAAVLSVSSPGVLLDGDLARAARLARTVNDEGAALVAAHPHRFGLFASLPLPDVEAAITETRYAFDRLAVDGITLQTNYGGTYLGNPAFEPLMAELDARAAVVHVHPTSPACWDQTALGRPRPMIEFPFDSTRAVAALALNGVLDRYPRVRFIVSHAGAALPVLADRLAGFAILESPSAPVDVLAALQRLHYDVAGFVLPRALPALLNLVAPERLLYGSDYPFTADWLVHGLAAALAGTEVLTEAQRQSMTRGQAEGLFPRLAHPRPGGETQTQP